VWRNTEWKDEVALFGAIVRVDPGSAVGNYNLGCALQERGDLEGARRAWERTVELDPRHAEALAQLGTVAAYGGDLARAERLYLAALAANAVDPMVHFNLARVYEGLGRPAEALARYDQFLRGAGKDHGDFVARAIERRARLAGAGSPAAPAAPSPR
jgi:Flp pilus assembly protein TadD